MSRKNRHHRQEASPQHIEPNAKSGSPKCQKRRAEAKQKHQFSAQSPAPNTEPCHRATLRAALEAAACTQLMTRSCPKKWIVTTTPSKNVASKQASTLREALKAVACTSLITKPSPRQWIISSPLPKAATHRESATLREAVKTAACTQLMSTPPPRQWSVATSQPKPVAFEENATLPEALKAAACTQLMTTPTPKYWAATIPPPKLEPFQETATLRSGLHSDAEGELPSGVKESLPPSPKHVRPEAFDRENTNLMFRCGFDNPNTVMKANKKTLSNLSTLKKLLNQDSEDSSSEDSEDIVAKKSSPGVEDDGVRLSPTRQSHSVRADSPMSKVAEILTPPKSISEIGDVKNLDRRPETPDHKSIDESSSPAEEQSSLSLTDAPRVNDVRRSPEVVIPVTTPDRTKFVRVNPDDTFTFANSPQTKEIFRAIDAVTAEVFNVTPSIELLTLGKDPPSLQDSCKGKLQPEGKVVASIDPTVDQSVESSEVTHAERAVEVHQDGDAQPTAIILPNPQRKKRKMTGLTSKHFGATPPKKLKGLKTEEKSQDTSQYSPPNKQTEESKDGDAITHTLSPKDTKPARAKRKSTATKSDHFLPVDLLDRVDLPLPGRPRAPKGVSIAPFPSINKDTFGIIQEKLWQEPFWLLIAVILLNKTTGRTAIPTFWTVKERWPTIQAMSQADEEELCAMIRHCGLQRARSRKMIKCAQTWLRDLPAKGRRYRTLHYPIKEDGKEYRRDVVIDTDATAVAGALEIAHLPGCGHYAYDSWRIFCRDVCREVARDYNGLDAVGQDFEPEWKRVLPLDKELRATLRWMWLKEGFIWNCETGERRPATEQEMRDAVEGQIEIADADERRFAALAVDNDSSTYSAEQQLISELENHEVVTLSD